MHKILKFVVAAACILPAFQAGATRGLKISGTSHGTKDKYYANAEGKINGIVSTVTLENTGDETLNPGDDDYTLTLYQYNYSQPAVDIVTVAIGESIAPGESKSLQVAWPEFDITQVYSEGEEDKSSWRDRYDIRENVSASTCITTPWLEIFPYKTSFSIVPEDSGTAYTSPINFGFVEEAKTLKFRIRNTGAADLNITSITLPEGFTASPAAPFTMAGLAAAEPQEFQELAITFSPAASGAYAGNMVISAEGADPVSLQVSGAMIGEDDFFESFEQPDGQDNSYVPAGWIFGEKWLCGYKNSSADDKYVLDHSSADDDYYTFAISPKLTFTEGGVLMFQACKKSSYSRLEVMVSPDRANWTPLALYTPNGTEEGSTKFPTVMNTLGDYSLSIPAGNWYIGFKGLYTSVNNVFGGKIARIDHDVYAVSHDFPAKMTVNNSATFSATFRNMNSVAEAAGSYTVELLADGNTVATVEASEWEAGADKTFSAAYTPHTAGETLMSFRVTLGNTVVSSPETTVTVEPENSNVTVIVGESTTTSNYVPAQLNYENATSQMILTQEYLTKYGITSGAKITGLTFMGRTSKDIDLHKKVKFYISNEPEQTSITKNEVRDLSDVTPAYSNDSQTISLTSGDFTLSIPLDEPFIYAGGNIFASLLVEEIENGQYGSVSWQASNELTTNAIYKYNDSDTSFPTATWNDSKFVPVIAFAVFNEAATLSGTVTGNGSPLAGTEVTATSGEVIYSAVTDSEGRYSMEIFQPELTYTVTIDDPSYPVYTSEVSFGEGSKVLDITMPLFSQERDYALTINVTDNAGCSYDGVPVKLVSDRFSLEYDASETTLDANGSVTLNVYGGAHTATVTIPGMKTAAVTFPVNKDRSIDIALEEDVNTPYSLVLMVDHDIVTGANDLIVTWNGEETIFADNFEQHPAFTIDPTPWTGIDGDLLAPAVLEGEYNNQGQPNYGQIINPSAVVPAWNLDNFYTLKPRSGKQYLGFITPADNAKTLNDWMITPAVTLSGNNIVRFFAKGSDRVPAKFTVGITEADAPAASDFTVISDGNAIECGFAEWTPVEISLDEYAGKTVKIGIHCISESGSFISMVDDFFIGRPSAADSAAKTKARRVVKSAANPNERFEIYLDGEKYGETTGYEFTIPAIAEGHHTVGVKAVYVNAESELLESTCNIDNSNYTKVNVNVTSNNSVIPASTAVNIANDTYDYSLQVADGALSLAALPKGSYTVTATAPDYDNFTSEVNVDDECNIDIALVESLVKPFNISAETEQDGNLFNVTLKWNQDLGFADSFEDYDDFATGQFGGWTTLDFDTQPSYPISLGSMSNIITFPGCSTPEAPAAVPPMVFNPFSTTPSMESDLAIYAPDGVKSIAFFGPQQATADKWLITPAMPIGEGYELKFLAKAYGMFPESLQICVSTTGTDKEDFTVLDEVSPSAASWTQYILPLDDYSGQEVYLGIHCVSADGFIVQVDDVKVAPVESDRVVPTGNVLNYDIDLDGTRSGSTQATVYTLSGLTEGKHKVAVTANYVSGSSAPGEYELELIDTAIDGTAAGADMAMGLDGAILVNTASEKVVELYTTSGVSVASATVNGSHTFAVEPGVYIVRAGSSTFKVAAR